MPPLNQQQQETLNNATESQDFLTLSEPDQIQFVEEIGRFFAEQRLAPVDPAAALDPDLSPQIGPDVPGPRGLGAAVGGTVGAVAASLLPLTGPAGIAAVAGLVFLGGAAGERADQAKRAQARGETLPVVPKTFEENKELAQAGAEQVGLEFIGRGVVKIAQKPLRLFRKKLDPIASEILRRFKGIISDPVLRPGEALAPTGLARLVGIAQNIGDNAIFSGRATAFRVTRQGEFENLADSMIQGLGRELQPDELGILFESLIEKKLSTHKAASDVLYNTLGESIPKPVTRLIPTTRQVDSGLVDTAGRPIMRTVTETVEREELTFGVPTASLKAWAEKRLPALQEIRAITTGQEQNALSTFESITKLPGEISFEAAKNLRTELLEISRRASIENPKARTVGIAKRGSALMDDAIEDTFETKSPGLLSDWRDANAFFKDGKDQFDNVMIRRLMRMASESGQGAEFIASAAVAPGKITTLRKVKTALTPIEFQNFQRFALQKIIADSFNETTETLGGVALRSKLFGRTGYGKQYLEELFPKPVVNDLRLLSEALVRGQQAQAGGIGTMWIQLSQAGAVAALATGGLTTGAATLLFGPALLSRIMLNPTGAKLLTRGVQLPANSNLVSGLAARLLAVAVKESRTMAQDEKAATAFSNVMSLREAKEQQKIDQLPPLPIQTSPGGLSL